MNKVKKNQLIQKYGPLVAEHLDRAMQAKAQGEYLKESIHKTLARDLRKKQLLEGDRDDPMGFGDANNDATNGNMIIHTFNRYLAQIKHVGNLPRFIILDYVRKLWDSVSNFRHWAAAIGKKSPEELTDWIKDNRR